MGLISMRKPPKSPPRQRIRYIRLSGEKWSSCAYLNSRVLDRSTHSQSLISVRKTEVDAQHPRQRTRYMRFSGEKWCICVYQNYRTPGPSTPFQSAPRLVVREHMMYVVGIPLRTQLIDPFNAGHTRVPLIVYFLAEA